MPTIPSLPHFPRGSLDIDHDPSYIPPASLSVHSIADVNMTSAAGRFPGSTPGHTVFQRHSATLSYRNSDVGDSRDRNYSRNHRNLVVVTPPSDLPLHQGQLGHVLSTGPRHRLSQGILMPLFSSMYGQLNAIAREYNFPSIMGLCLYLHVNENGMTVTPRVSEDCWQYLFGHLFETRPLSGGQQLPIFGRIEFDIDLNKARWFDAWISRSFRDLDPFLPVVTSGASLETESETMRVDKPPIEDQWNASGPYTLPNKPRPETLRHLPKKLSLVDRLDSHSPHVPPPRLHQLNSSHTHDFDALSPALQSAFSQVAKGNPARPTDLWKESTELYSVSALKPTVDVEASTGAMDAGTCSLERNSQRSVDINQPFWSSTSAGPGLVTKSTVASSRPSSIHLDGRGNVFSSPSPTTVTSWGPPDDEWHSAASNVSRPPSPEPDTCSSSSVPTQPQPSTLSVWGKSFGWSRGETWKKVYPYSAVETQLVAPIQLCGAGGLVPKYPNLHIYPAIYPYLEIYPTCTIEEDVEEEDISGPVSVTPNGSKHFTCSIKEDIEEDISSPVSVTPNGSNNWTMHYPNLIIYPAVYPYFSIYPIVKDLKHSPNQDLVTADVAVEKRAIWGNSFGWEYATTWRAVWPTASVKTDSNFCVISTHDPQDGDQTDMISVERPPSMDLGQLFNDDAESNEPRCQPWHLVWPFFGSDTEIKSVISYPQLEICQTSENVAEPKNHASEMLTNPNRYPVFDIYPAVYPHFDIYPAIDLQLESLPEMTTDVWQKPVEVKLLSLYPNFDIYHAGYPYNLASIYPSINATEPLQPECTEEEPVVYPHFDIYPAAQPLPPQQEGVIHDADVDDPTSPLLQIHATSGEREMPPSSCLEKRPRRTHLQLHTEVFLDGVVWTPSGYTQDLISLTTRQPKEIQVEHPRPHLPRLSLGSLSVKSPDKTISPFLQPALPPTPPLHVHIPDVPSETSVIAAVTSVHSSPINVSTQEQKSPYFSTVLGAHKHNSSPKSPNLKDLQFPVKFLPLVGLRPTFGSPAPSSIPEFRRRAPQHSLRKGGMVSQLVRAYEESTVKR